MNTRRMQCIGEHLRRERRIRDKTLEQVADAVGLKKNTISAYEKGKISIPIDNLDIATYLQPIATKIKTARISPSGMLT